ncbi:MAG: DNA primase [Pelagibacterales bacterium]|nr:DNA primase [Pelagibacterales bacterium]OUV27012.1 MAG: DNA primase [Alphaproteobacteria bacterium TMED109]
MAFSDNLVDIIHDKVLLSDVISKTVNLSKKGSDFIGLCPFHNEKTPSFTVSNDKGFYHCFGCGAHGDVISFIMEKESIDFKEAIKILASEAGINISDYSFKNKKISKEELKLKEILEISKDYFKINFNSTSGDKVKNYLEKRKISLKASSYFELGFAKNISASLIAYLKDKNFSDENIIQTGLARKSNKNNQHYDFFRNRLIFPIHNHIGEVVAFGGRSMDGLEPKYLNSPDTILFKKRKLLFNFHRAKKYVQKKKLPFIVVEGYLDVISLYHIGVYGAVAPLGTALSEEQLILLWKVSDEPIIFMDGDEAGYRSAIRTLNIAMKILKPGKSLKFILLEDGKDPDNLVSQGKKNQILDLINNAIPMFKVFWNSEIKNLDLESPEKRASFRLSMEKKISLINDKIIQKEYKKSFYIYYNNFFSNKYSNNQKYQINSNHSKLDKLNADRVNKKSYASLREKNLIESVFNNPNLLKLVEEEFALLTLSNNDLEMIRLALLDLYKKNGDLTDLNIIELKEDIRYSSIISNIFKLSNWNIAKFTSEYVKKNEDINFVAKCWLEAANIQNVWKKREK